MSSNGYTAKQMRDAANSREAWGYKDEVNNMLRQAANAMERKKKREKKYEYKVLYCIRNGRTEESIRHTEDIKTARRILGIYASHKDANIVRREVGEWEKVK